MNFKKIFLSIFLILLLVSISVVSAHDNATDVENTEADSDIEEIEICTEDTVNADDNTSAEILSSSVSDENEILCLDTEEDVYFDASAKSDGTGTIDNPFKYLAADRLPYGCTAHFKNGVYEVDSNCRLLSNDGSDLFDVSTKVTFIGESTAGVIFRNLNSSIIPFTVADNSRLYIYNATFDNCVIENRGRLEAYGVVFKNGVAVDHYYASTAKTYNNRLGGAIFSPGSHYALVGSGMKTYLVLEDCLFKNNSAVYGGAIYHDYGTTKIKNTKFIDNYAELYGGVLATDGGSITIENCEFLNYGAAGDAGGAIYAKTTNLTVKDSKFSNGYADFGGAICELNSNLIIENTDFYNHSAKYEGGAVYIMYGDINLKKVNFTLNSALDGGALFVDNCTNVNLNKVKFEQSSAKRYGGTIFSNGHQVDTANDITFSDSSAPMGPVIYHQDKYDYDIGYNADYELMKYKSSYEGILPSRFDLRELGYVTPVRDQQEGGNCWAFAGIAALESCILKATGKSFDLSEENVKNLIELYSAYGWKEDTNEGGHSEMTWGNLISWLGPVLEEDDPYDDYSTLSTLFDAIMHVQNVYYLPARTTFLDNDAIKRAIMDYGAISVTMYADFDSPMNFNKNTSAYFLATSTKAYANHAVTVVGWDDNYDRHNFPLGDMAETNGAWIVKNSWNTDWGDEGYFYVSYYDPVVFKKGEKNVAYTFILNDTQKYNRNYQYDIGGMTDFLYPTGNNETLYYKNTFTAIGNDILCAASTVFEDAMDYELSVFINGALKHTQYGHAFAGYNTIPLINEYQLTAGDKFTIQFKISQKGGASIPICEVVTATRLTYSEGISFFSNNGDNWEDLYTFKLDRPEIEHRYASQVACIKAFTKSSGIKIGSSVKVDDVTGTAGEIVKITATVKDENGKLINTGIVTFDVDGKKESVKVINGRAVLETVFDKTGTFEITVKYDGGDSYYNSTGNAKAVISASSVKYTDIEAKDVSYTYGEDNTISAKLTDSNGNPLSDMEMQLKINSNKYTAKTDKNGIVKFNVNLAAGEYEAKFKFEGNNLFKKSEAKITVKVISSGNTQSDIVNVHYDYDKDGSIITTITDESGNAVADKEVTLTVEGKSYTAKTDENGVAKFNIDLPNGEYQAKIEVPGKTVSKNSPQTLKVGYAISDDVDSIEAKNTTRAQNSRYDFEAKFYDKKGNVLGDKEVQFIINGNDYFVKTNEYGIARLTLNLSVGTYEITIINPATNERLIRNATIIPRIIGGGDLKVDYTYSGIYKVQLYGDNGQIVGAGESVVIKVGGKTFNAVTDKDGFASAVIKGLTPKTYTITAEYKGVVISNKLVVKHIIKAKNKKFKRYKVKKYSVTLKTSLGKAIKGKKITFKIKGKSYKAKTNNKGIASIKIKALTKVGKYKITIKYLKSTVKKTITVKR